MQEGHHILNNEINLYNVLMLQVLIHLGCMTNFIMACYFSEEDDSSVFSLLKFLHFKCWVLCSFGFLSCHYDNFWYVAQNTGICYIHG